MGSWIPQTAVITVMNKRLIAAVLFCAILPGLLSASAPRDPYQFFFEQSLGDLTEELEIAREQGKQGIFVFFEMDECPFCHRMKKTVLNQPEVQAYFRQNFHNLTVDIEGDIEIVDFIGADMTQKEFARQNRARNPAVGILRPRWQAGFQIHRCHIGR